MAVREGNNHGRARQSRTVKGETFAGRCGAEADGVASPAAGPAGSRGVETRSPAEAALPRVLTGRPSGASCPEDSSPASAGLPNHVSSMLAERFLLNGGPEALLCPGAEEALLLRGL